ncbi:MAG: OmpA family protein [Novosphingobium sp.]|nr:OmpA family protein [Novosphingobium sp.]
MPIFRPALILAGAAAVVGIGFASEATHGPELIAAIESEANAARDDAGGHGIEIGFKTAEGWLTRHAVLSGGKGIANAKRADAARAIAQVPGIGGVQWKVSGNGEPGDQAALHCQDDVEAILDVRTIRFAESSSSIDPASEKLLDEVASALKPCLGSIIAITGHTDSNGDASANIALSQARADAVRWALIGRGIPADGLRASGKGAVEPIKGLDPSDSANRRIDFSVIETVPLKPTPIDTPGPG